MTNETKLTLDNIHLQNLEQRAFANMTPSPSAPFKIGGMSKNRVKQDKKETREMPIRFLYLILFLIWHVLMLPAGVFVNMISPPIVYVKKWALDIPILFKKSKEQFPHAIESWDFTSWLKLKN